LAWRFLPAGRRRRLAQALDKIKLSSLARLLQFNPCPRLGRAGGEFEAGAHTIGLA
jgi:hypothetical protein